MDIGSFVRRLILISFFILSAICVSKAHPSPQSPDYLIYKGDTIAIYELILEQYLHSQSQADSGSLFGLSFRDGASTNCWRGYQAIFVIENDTLFLKYVLPCHTFRSKTPLDLEYSQNKINALFGHAVVKGRVFGFWYSGSIVFPRGPMLRWDGVFSRTYKNEEIIDFKNGVLKSKSLVDNYVDLPNGIARDLPNKWSWDPNNKLVTDSIFSLIKHFNWRRLSDRFDCDDKYIIEIGPDGRIKSVRMDDMMDEPKLNRKCSRKIMNAIRNLQFDIVKWHSQPYSEKIYFEVFFDDKKGLENWSQYPDQVNEDLN